MPKSKYTADGRASRPICSIGPSALARRIEIGCTEALFLTRRANNLPKAISRPRWRRVATFRGSGASLILIRRCIVGKTSGRYHLIDGRYSPFYRPKTRPLGTKVGGGLFNIASRRGLRPLALDQYPLTFVALKQ